MNRLFPMLMSFLLVGCLQHDPLPEHRQQARDGGRDQSDLQSDVEGDLDERDRGKEMDVSTDPGDTSELDGDQEDASDAGRTEPYWSAVSVGTEHVCGIADGDVYCWGNNGSGQLGTSSSDEVSPTPVPVDLPGSATAVSAAEGHSCAVANGEVHCWGTNYSGRVYPTGMTVGELEPTVVNGIMPGDMPTLVSSSGHNCVTGTSNVVCWGDNTRLECGQSQAGAYETGGSVPETMGYIDVDVGEHASCGLDPVGELYCWGSSDSPLVDNETDSSNPVPLPDTPFSEISIGYDHGCGVDDAAGKVACWGSNTFHEDLEQVDKLGLDVVDDKPRPDRYVADGDSDWEPLEKPVGVAAGYDHTCVLLDNGDVYCFGKNVNGEVGEDVGQVISVPQKVESDTKFASIAAGLQVTCGITDAGDLYCWGNNGSGQLGIGTTDGGPYTSPQLNELNQ